MLSREQGRGKGPRAGWLELERGWLCGLSRMDLMPQSVVSPKGALQQQKSQWSVTQGLLSGFNGAINEQVFLFIPMLVMDAL